MTKKTTEEWPPKAYKNLEFLNSPAARQIRILCELEETEQRFKKENIEDTIVMFGSARTLPIEEAKSRMAELEKRLAGKKNLSVSDKEELRLAKANLRNAPYYEHAMELSGMLTRWSMSLLCSSCRSSSTRWLTSL